MSWTFSNINPLVIMQLTKKEDAPKAGNKISQIKDFVLKCRIQYKQKI